MKIFIKPMAYFLILSFFFYSCTKEEAIVDSVSLDLDSYVPGDYTAISLNDAMLNIEKVRTENMVITEDLSEVSLSDEKVSFITRALKESGIPLLFQGEPDVLEQISEVTGVKPETSATLFVSIQKDGTRKTVVLPDYQVNKTVLSGVENLPANKDVSELEYSQNLQYALGEGFTKSEFDVKMSENVKSSVKSISEAYNEPGKYPGLVNVGDFFMTKNPVSKSLKNNFRDRIAYCLEKQSFKSTKAGSVSNGEDMHYTVEYYMPVNNNGGAEFDGRVSSSNKGIFTIGYRADYVVTQGVRLGSSVEKTWVSVTAKPTSPGINVMPHISTYEKNLPLSWKGTKREYLNCLLQSVDISIGCRDEFDYEDRQPATEYAGGSATNSVSSSVSVSANVLGGRQVGASYQHGWSYSYSTNDVEFLTTNDPIPSYPYKKQHWKFSMKATPWGDYAHDDYFNNGLKHWKQPIFQPISEYPVFQRQNLILQASMTVSAPVSRTSSLPGNRFNVTVSAVAVEMSGERASGDNNGVVWQQIKRKQVRTYTHSSTVNPGIDFTF